MEVHTHTHTARKKWTHYFWEFLMLFLAVFCGFLAEYQLEHMIEHQREKEYIKSMREDLREDTANLSIVIHNFLKKESQLERVLKDFDSGISDYSPVWTSAFVGSVRSGYADFFYTDRTVQQLKNAGGLRLIRNKNATKGIIEYDAVIKDLDRELEVLTFYQGKYMEIADRIWSFRSMYRDQGVLQWQRNPELPVTKNYWISRDPLDFEHLFTQASQFRYTFARLRRQMDEVRQKAIDLIRLLVEEYHLKQ